MSAGTPTPDAAARDRDAPVLVPRHRRHRPGAHGIPGKHVRHPHAGSGHVPGVVLPVLLREGHRRDPHRVLRHRQPLRRFLRAAGRPGQLDLRPHEGAGDRHPAPEADGDLQRLHEGVRQGDRQTWRRSSTSSGRSSRVSGGWSPDGLARRDRRPRDRRGHRRPAGGARPGRPRFPRAARRTRGEHRREDDRAQQGLPDDGLRELHHDPPDVGRCAPREHHHLDLRRRRVDRPGRRRLLGHDHPQAALRRRGPVHRLPALRVRLPGGRAP